MGKETTTKTATTTIPFNAEQSYKDLSDRLEKDRNLILTIMAGLVAFVAVTFLIEVSAMHRNYAQDKTILLEMNTQNKDYFDEVLMLNNSFQEMNTKIELIKARNYLK